MRECVNACTYRATCALLITWGQIALLFLVLEHDPRRQVRLKALKDLVHLAARGRHVSFPLDKLTGLLQQELSVELRQQAFELLKHLAHPFHFQSRCAASNAAALLVAAAAAARSASTSTDARGDDSQ